MNRSTKSDVDASALAGGVYVVSTPIGNMGDITVRALDVLAHVAVIFCEDTRVTLKLMRHYQITTPLFALHAHNEASMIDSVLTRLRTGVAVALVSDAGTPVISDPGVRVIAAVRSHGFSVFSVPGASAPIAAMSISGLSGGPFCFIGFLPSQAGARSSAISKLPRDAGVVILFESPHRIRGLLSSLIDVWGDVSVVIAREMTKLHEEVICDLASEVLVRLPPRPRGEFVVLVTPPPDVAVSDSIIEAALHNVLGRMSRRDAVVHIAARYGLTRRDAYQRILAFKDDDAPTI